MPKSFNAPSPAPSQAPAVEVGSPAAAWPGRRRTRGLAHDLVDDFSGRIQAQLLRPGDKLPTESELMKAFGVSRTVVREALSRLQAAGLVETRHGIGTFVLEARSTGMFRIDPSDMATSVEVLAVLELRVSLETESAGLAAVRRTEAQLQAMREALNDFAANVGEGGDTVSPDFRFHLEIAQATGNRYFGDIMSHLGTTIIPRTRISSAMRMAPELRAQYLQKVNREHEEIFEAIARQDADSARAAMRIHLTNSRERLRRAQALAQAASEAAAAPEGIPRPAASD
ncbi:FadR/GntR family transcriptional regulator [Curvibacter sp. HBC61]|uniref:FadR/GntR family transcriptional regulator n=1 Tax=Curvibacter cyanobacteriorum TaxID=3026422 RepID=A0ABT5MZA1_9BURK|nr:FadR/GntR family transcriptional regulator [Curvibacter sp. HBC61]MDD0838611.1 FadR/GntR family transcriptional regulator [Curvibacter sp. HBC61]